MDAASTSKPITSGTRSVAARATGYEAEFQNVTSEDRCVHQVSLVATAGAWAVTRYLTATRWICAGWVPLSGTHGAQIVRWNDRKRHEHPAIMARALGEGR